MFASHQFWTSAVVTLFPERKGIWKGRNGDACPFLSLDVRRHVMLPQPHRLRSWQEGRVPRWRHTSDVPLPRFPSFFFFVTNLCKRQFIAHSEQVVQAFWIDCRPFLPKEGCHSRPPCHFVTQARPKMATAGMLRCRRDTILESGCLF